MLRCGLVVVARYAFDNLLPLALMQQEQQTNTVHGRSPSPTLPRREGGELSRAAVAQVLTVEGVLTRAAVGAGISPGALRVLVLTWAATRQGARAVTLGVLYELGGLHPVTIRRHVPAMTRAGYLSRTRATRTHAPLLYLTHSGADVVKRYILAQQRAERATARRLADFC